MYPVTYEADYPGGGRNRLTTFFRYFVSIPWLIVSALWGFAAYFAVIAAWFAIVFTGRYPEGLYTFVGGYIRFNARAAAFFGLATDEYPPFHGNPDDSYPVRVGIPPPLPEYDRVKTGFRFIIGIPVMLLNFVQALIATVIAFIAWFAILFTGQLSEGLFKTLRSALAYGTTRSAAYLYLLTEDYPPFSLEESPAGQLPESPPAQPTPPAPGETQRPETGD
jgi:hypothetical protein